MSASLRARIGDRWRWWRHTWTFQLAHKPLCTRYAHDVIRLGAVRICRSCTCLYTGLGLGILSSCLVPAGAVSVFLTGLVIAAIVVPLSYPRWYRRWSRGARDLLRGGSGLAFAGLIAPLWLGSPWLGASSLALGGLLWFWFARVRREKKLAYCEGCPELPEPGVRSGYRYQADRINAYEDATLAHLARRGFTPQIGNTRRRP